MKNFLFSLIAISNLSAFSFDNWKSDTTLSIIKEQAKQKGIKLTNQNNLNKINKYDNVNSNHNEIVYTYNTNMVNRETTINLYFDNKDKKLYKAEAIFNLMGTNTNNFIDRVYSILDRKYSDGHREVHYYTNFWGNTYVVNNEERRGPYDTKYWQPDEETLIMSKTAFSGMKVIYIDPRLYHEKNTGHNKNNEEMIKDYSRF